MAVYERIWRRYAGALTSFQWRSLVISRYAIKDVFQSRAFLIFYCICFLPTVAALIVVYARHNLNLVEMLVQMTGGASSEVLEVLDSVVLYTLTWLFLAQAVPAFFLVVIVSPSLISADLSNNAMPLYLSRPINRRDYVIGKLAVLAILLSPVTWMSSCFVYLLQASYAGGTWWSEHFRIALGHLVGHGAWIIVISLLSLSLSALLRHKTMARGILLGQFLVLWGFSAIVNVVTRTSWGTLLDLRSVISVIALNLFAPDRPLPVPVWSAWAMLIAVSLASIAVLARQVKAHEVIS